jgi:hypothetical protein
MQLSRYEFLKLSLTHSENLSGMEGKGMGFVPRWVGTSLSSVTGPREAPSEVPLIEDKISLIYFASASFLGPLFICGTIRESSLLWEQSNSISHLLTAQGT